MQDAWPDPTTRIQSVMLVAAGPLAVRPGAAGPTVTLELPEHCELIASMQQRQGVFGQPFAIRFHLRLPSRWNGRFYFQGGGGSNGNLGDALGSYPGAAAPALSQGFAVVSQDSGHDNAVNNDAAHAGTLVFGFDAQARANYGHASLPLVARAARAAVARYYGAQPRHSYFVGCSKGGAEALALAERYPELFDGVLAGAPAMSLPRAAVAEAWDTQAVAQAFRASQRDTLRAANLHQAFSDADLALVRSAVLEACDNGDGLKDGMVGNFGRCTTARVRPALASRQCRGAGSIGCLNAGQVDALVRIMDGAHDSAGRPLYSSWPWDAGIASAGWRSWKMGAAGGQPQSLNVLLGGASLASVFTTPPTVLPADADALLQFLLAFDFDHDAPKIYAVSTDFPASAWAEISARSADLDGFRKRRGKLIVYHGVSDPVFSINDTVDWWLQVDRRYRGKADQFVRLFAVPGMNHCGGGEATDRFDALASLMRWVEQGEAPGHIIAQAGPQTPWPGRSRPLCPYPAVARYRGRGDTEQADSFSCSTRLP